MTTTTTPAPTTTTQYIAHEEQRKCAEGLCPGQILAGQPWSGWSHWLPCDATCGTGTTLRYRECQAFAPDPDDWRKKIIDRNMCRIGDDFETEPCNTQVCPYFSEWTPWEKCFSDQCLTDGYQK